MGRIFLKGCAVFGFNVLCCLDSKYSSGRRAPMFNPLGWLKVERAHAHCDIPCGIYDPIAAKIAAQTVQKMVLRIQALEAPGSQRRRRQLAFTYANTIARYVTVKEEHAEIVKKELSILWADYGWPNLSDRFRPARELQPSVEARRPLQTECGYGCLRRTGGDGGPHRHGLLVHQERDLQRPQRGCPLRFVAASSSPSEASPALGEQRVGEKCSTAPIFC